MRKMKADSYSPVFHRLVTTVSRRRKPITVTFDSPSRARSMLGQFNGWKNSLQGEDRTIAKGVTTTVARLKPDECSITFILSDQLPGQMAIQAALDEFDEAMPAPPELDLSSRPGPSAPEPGEPEPLTDLEEAYRALWGEPLHKEE